MTIVGRQKEQEMLKGLLEKKQAEFVAVYGRRRVGKTFLIRNVYQDELIFQLTGIHGVGLKEQLANFYTSVLNAGGAAFLEKPPANWMEAFEILRQFVDSKKGSPRVVFFDELPWLDIPGSDFIPALEHFWNAWASSQERLILVTCGSAASWMLNQLINSKGGLYNRVTQRIRLMPFTLQEMESYFRSRQIQLDRYQLLQLYMVMGGIPFYLEQVKPGRSAFQEIDRLCFTEGGILRNEFNNLYRSLFTSPEKHLAIIEVLSKKNKGLTREELIKDGKLSNGGNTTQAISELYECGFITPTYPFGKKIKATIYRLSDPYSLFFLSFIKDSKAAGEGAWTSRLDSPSWRAWSGYAFENICFVHIDQIRKALGISGIYTEIASWQSREKGAQIDLLIDRRDHIINVCEIKYSSGIFTIGTKLRKDLDHRLAALKEDTKTRKTILLVMITTFGLHQNEHSIALVQNSITMDNLFGSIY